ncbi:hypothetical protein, variant [Phialophora macrospora]|nr:hypothetical protein, variant [Phialophora macrospora]
MLRVADAATGSNDLNSSMTNLDKAVAEFRHDVFFSAASDNLQKAQNERNLKTLSQLSDLDLNSKHARLRKDRFFSNKLWILEEKEFKEWWSSKEKTLLWCHGPPGAGKSFLFSSILDSIRSRSAHPDQKTLDKKLGVAYVYCETSQQETQTAVQIFRSIIRQLVELDMSSRPDFDSALSLVKRFLSQQDGSVTMTTRSLAGLLSSVMKRFDETIVLIDALDECAYRVNGFPNRQDLIDRLTEVPKLKLLITSRDSPSDNVLKNAKVIEIRPKPADVDEYVASRLKGSEAGLDQSKDLQRKIKDAIGARYSALFILLHLFLNTICELPSIGAVEKVLAGPPLTLNEFYNKAIERIERGGRAEIAKRTLFLTLSSKVPLTLVEVQDAVAALDAQPSGADHKDYRPLEKTLWDCCAGLVVVNVESKVVSFAHESVREYLSGDYVRTKLFLFDQQTQMAGMCLKYLTYDTFGSGPCESIEMYRKRLDNYPFLRYAAQHWGHHIRGPPEQKLMQETLTFIRQDSKLSCAVQSMYIPRNQDKAGAFPKNVHGLWIASFFGLDEVLKRLLRESQPEPDAPDTDGQTGLMTAAKHGHAASVRSLLDGKAYLGMEDRPGTFDLEAESSSRNAYLELQDRSGFTALFWAAKRGHQACVRVLCESGANIDAADSNGETSLIGAARRWDEAMLQVLLEHRANIDARDRFGDTALITASKRGRTAIVRYLIGKGADLRKVDEMKRTALIAASEEGHESVVDLLLEKLDKLGNKALIEAMDCNMETALVRAVKRRHVSVVEILLRYGANIESTDQFGDRPLYLAAGQGLRNIVDVLLRAKPMLDAENEQGRTALMAAAEGGHESILNRLLELGANPEKLESHGETALISAIRKGHASTIHALLSKPVSGIDKWDRFGETALIAACQKSTENASMNGIVLKLLEAGADVNNQGVAGKGPLHWAVEEGNITLTKLLLERGANADHTDKYYFETPLMGAATKGMTNIAQLLLDHGANPNLPQWEGHSPLMRATSSGHENIVALLLQRGVDMEAHTSQKESALSLAISNYQTNIFRQLVDEMRKKKSQREFITYLWDAVCRGSIETVAGRARFFMASGTDSIAENDFMSGEARFLVDSGIDINSEDVDGRTFLDTLPRLEPFIHDIDRVAADIGKVLDLGATQGSRYTSGETLLSAAVGIWSSVLVKAHLARGADIDERNNDHQTPLMVAIQQAVAFEEIQKGSFAYYIIHVLLHNGARVDAQDRTGRSAVDLAIQGGHRTIVKLLMHYGARVREEDLMSLTKSLDDDDEEEDEEDDEKDDEEDKIEEHSGWEIQIPKRAPRGKGGR